MLVLDEEDEEVGRCGVVLGWCCGGAVEWCRGGAVVWCGGAVGCGVMLFI
jgi:hypothetical protein